MIHQNRKGPGSKILTLSESCARKGSAQTIASNVVMAVHVTVRLQSMALLIGPMVKGFSKLRQRNQQRRPIAMQSQRKRMIRMGNEGNASPQIP